MYTRLKESSILGKTLASWEISKDRERVYLHATDGTTCVLQAYPECCSNSWIEEFDGSLIVGGKVLRIEERYIDPSDYQSDLLPTKYPNKQQEFDIQCFYEIITDKGSATIEMRNSSNGHYGGRLLEVTGTW